MTDGCRLSMKLQTGARNGLRTVALVAVLYGFYELAFVSSIHALVLPGYVLYLGFSIFEAVVLSGLSDPAVNAFFVGYLVLLSVLLQLLGRRVYLNTLPHWRDPRGH